MARREIAPNGDAAKATRNILAEAIVALERMQWQHQRLHAENGQLRKENDRLRNTIQRGGSASRGGTKSPSKAKGIR